MDWNHRFSREIWGFPVSILPNKPMHCCQDVSIPGISWFLLRLLSSVRCSDRRHDGRISLIPLRPHERPVIKLVSSGSSFLAPFLPCPGVMDNLDFDDFGTHRLCPFLIWLLLIQTYVETTCAHLCVYHILFILNFCASQFSSTPWLMSMSPSDGWCARHYWQRLENYSASACKKILASAVALGNHHIMKTLFFMFFNVFQPFTHGQESN